MVPINYVLAAFVFLTGFCSAGLSVYSWLRRRTDTSAAPLAALMATSTVYMLGYGFVLLQSDPERAFFFMCVGSVGIAFIPACFVALAVAFSPNRQRLFSPLVPVSIVLSLALFAVIATNGLHRLYYTDISLDPTAPFPAVRVTRGPLALFKNVYYLAAMTFAIARYARRIANTGGIDRERMILFIATFLIGGVGQYVTITGLVPWNIDAFPFFFLPICLLTAYGIRRKDLFDIGSRASKLVVSAMGDAVLVIVGDGTILEANPAVARFFPYAPARLAGTSLADLSEDLSALCEKLSCGDTGEIALPAAEGTLFASVTLLKISGSSGERAGVALMLHDTTEAKRHVTLLEELVIHDGLTGCYTRRHWLSLAERELARSSRTDRRFSVIMVDIDHFKLVNDSRGHAVGDLVLKDVTEAMQRHLRATDSLGRLGGEEFAVLLPETPLETAVVTAERLRSTVETLTARGCPGKTSVPVTISLGVAVSGPDAVTMSELLREADRALYEAKRKGRNRVEASEIRFMT